MFNRLSHQVLGVKHKKFYALKNHILRTLEMCHANPSHASSSHLNLDPGPSHVKEKEKGKKHIMDRQCPLSPLPPLRYMCMDKQNASKSPFHEV